MVAGVVGSLFGSAHALFREAVRDRVRRTIGYLQERGDRTIVQDRCFTRLGWVISAGMEKGTYPNTGEKIADSLLLFMLLAKPNPSCPTPVPQ